MPRALTTRRMKRSKCNKWRTVFSNTWDFLVMNKKEYSKHTKSQSSVRLWNCFGASHHRTGLVLSKRYAICVASLLITRSLSFGTPTGELTAPNSGVGAEANHSYRSFGCLQETEPQHSQGTPQAAASIAPCTQCWHGRGFGCLHVKASASPIC